MDCGGALNQAVRLLLPFSDLGRRGGEHLRGHAVSRDHRGRCARNLDQRYGGRGGKFGRRPLDRAAPCNAADDRPVVARRSGSDLGAFGEFGATITFAGNLQGRTQTLPLAVFVALEGDRDTAVALVW